MPTIRDAFHDIGNKHNKISISSGVLRESLKQKKLDALSSQELKEENAKLVKSLDDIEKFALEANGALRQLKRAIYDLVNPDKEIPNKE